MQANEYKLFNTGAVLMIFNYDTYEPEYTAVVSSATLFSETHDVVGVRGISWRKSPGPGEVELAGVFECVANAFVIFTFVDSKLYFGQISWSKYNEGCSFRGEHMLYFKDALNHMMQIMY